MAKSPINKKTVYLEPVNKVIEELESSTKSTIFLVGGEGAGKSVVLKEYQARNNNSDNIVIDGTVENDNMISLVDCKIFELNQVCLLIQKMLKFVKTTKSEKFLGRFAELEERINYFLKIINLMYFYGNYSFQRNEIPSEIIENPEILLEGFLKIGITALDYQTITIVLDNFDVIGGPNKYYQEYMYKMLSEYMRLVVTVSDSRVINNQGRIEELSKTNDVVKVDYSKNVEIIKEILSNEFIRLSILSGNVKYRVSIDSILSDETIALMIEKTNGNLFDMIQAVRELYNKMNELLPNEYELFVLNYRE